MKQRKKQNKEQSLKTPLPEALFSFDSEGVFGKVYRKKYFGKFSFSSTVVFSLSLPHLLSPEFEETEKLLQDIAQEFLTFLEKKSRENKEDAFGGLSFSATENGFLISAAFCSPKERLFLPVFFLSLSPEGKLLAVKKQKAE